MARSLIPRQCKRVTINIPKEFDQITVTLNEDQIKNMIMNFLRDEQIGPERHSLPDKFTIDCNNESPLALSVTFHVEVQ